MDHSEKSPLHLSRLPRDKHRTAYTHTNTAKTQAQVPKLGCGSSVVSSGLVIRSGSVHAPAPVTDLAGWQRYVLPTVAEEQVAEGLLAPMLVSLPALLEAEAASQDAGLASGSVGAGLPRRARAF